MKLKNLSGQVDRYGRKIKKGSASAVKELSQFYDIDDSENPDDSHAIMDKSIKSFAKFDTESRLDYLNKLSRGEISGSSSDEDDNVIDSESASESDDNDEVEVDTNQTTSRLKKLRSPLDIPENEELEYSDEVKEDTQLNDHDFKSTNRLAVLHCEWSHLSAEDIMYVNTVCYK